MLEELKQRVLDANLLLPKYGLITFTWGNVSEIDREKGIVAIKPSGVEYDVMTRDDIVLVDLDGNIVEGNLRPSSDLDTHLEFYRNFKIMVETLNSYKTDKEDVAHLPFYQRFCNKVTSWIRPGLFIFSAVLVLCSASIWLNIRLATRMQQLQDNDMKYRFLLMQGWANGEVLDILEAKFNWQRDNDFIQSLTDSVIDFEYRSKKQAEALERAR